MATPHISAEIGAFAKTVLMPGDPLRAEFIAKEFLQDAKLITQVRGMFGYTGTYCNMPVSVMGSGMGMPSMGIYSYELFTQYDVETIIRIGSAGSYTEKAKLYDTILVKEAYSESSFAKTQSGYAQEVIEATQAVNNRLRTVALQNNKHLIEGRVHSTDVFYRHAQDDYWKIIRDEKQCLAVEMESFALFHHAKVLHKNAACLLTISDSFISQEQTNAKQRQTSFTDMIQIALKSLLL